MPRARKDSPERSQRSGVSRAAKHPSKPKSGSKRPGQPPDRWYEVVRTQRMFYEQFRIAFPHLATFPKHYSDEWADQFRAAAQRFVKTENMKAVRKVLLGAGYETDRWTQVIEYSTEEIASAIDRLLAGVSEQASVEGGETDGTEMNDLRRLREALGPDRWELLLANPAGLAPAIDEHLRGVGEREAAGAEEGDGKATYQLVVDKNAELEAELEDVKRRYADSREENRGLHTQVGEKDTHIGSLEEQLRRAGQPGEGDTAPEETDGNTEHGEGDDPGLIAELEEAQRRYEELREEVRELNVEIGDKNLEIRTLKEQLRKLEATGGKPAARDASREAPKKFTSPTEMADRLRELEQTLRANEELIAGLRSQVERDTLLIEEMKGDLERERQLRRKFEEELEEERRQLREQINRLGSMLGGEVELPSVDELEQMDGEELLNYIGEVETEKQRVLAGLDALDAQEESYKKQIETQQEELVTIQEDVEKYKGSNLASEVGDLESTIEKQRSQLQTLLGYSKNLKTQHDQLTERVEPMRNLVSRLSSQEKALVRYVRIKYDRAFMPEEAYTQTP